MKKTVQMTPPLFHQYYVFPITNVPFKAQCAQVQIVLLARLVIIFIHLLELPYVITAFHPTI